MDDDGDETPERRKEMLALRQAGYGDRVAVSLGNVPTGPVKDYSFRGRNALRKPAGIKSGSRPVKSANELWASHKDEPGKNSRDRTPNGSIRNSNGALGALGAGGFNTGGSPAVVQRRQQGRIDAPAEHQLQRRTVGGAPAGSRRAHRIRREREERREQRRRLDVCVDKL